ncbi:MAG: KEOPS complex subunit Pcc1 [Methermicoccaceae archaeon]
MHIHCALGIPCPYEQVYHALKVESCSVPTDRGTVAISLEEDVLMVEVETEDVSSLRASLNTWLRLVNEAIEVAHLLSESEHI